MAVADLEEQNSYPDPGGSGSQRGGARDQGHSDHLMMEMKKDDSKEEPVGLSGTEPGTRIKDHRTKPV